MEGEKVLPPTTVTDEIISVSELDMKKYVENIDRLLAIKTADSFTHKSYKNAFNEFYISACSVLEELEDFNILYGSLIRNMIFSNMPADDDSAEYYFQTKKNILYGLSELIDINWRVKDILEKIYLEKDIDFTFIHKRFAETSCIHYFTMDKIMKEEFYFDSLQNYFTFLMMKFLSSKPNVVLCGYCGRFFIPKTKKETFYCDRIIKNMKTCKQLAPAHKHRLVAKDNAFIQAFDKNKGKMYKRLERTNDSLHETEKSLTLTEYYDWLYEAERVRREFLMGNISEENALKSICV